MASTKTQMKKPVWLKYSEEEVKEIILKIAEKTPGITTEKIGLLLRDNYGIPTTKIYGFKIGDVLKKAKKYESADLKNLSTKLAKILKHIGTNKQDQKTKRSLILTKAKLKKVNEYLASKA